MGWLDCFRSPQGPPPWRFPGYEGPAGRAQFEFFVYGATPLPAGLDWRTEGHYDASPDVGLEFVPEARADDDDLFDDDLYVITEGLDALDPAIDKAVWGTDRRLVIAGDVESPPDLTHLQAAWAAVRAACRAGGVAVYDNRAGLWRTAARVLEPSPDPTALARGFRVLGALVDESQLTILWTQGLVKFGRRDLALLTEAETVPMGQRVLADLAEGVTLGRALVSGEAIDLDYARVHTEPYAAGFTGPELPFASPHQALLVRLEA